MGIVSFIRSCLLLRTWEYSEFILFGVWEIGMRGLNTKMRWKTGFYSFSHALVVIFGDWRRIGPCYNVIYSWGLKVITALHEPSLPFPSSFPPFCLILLSQSIHFWPPRINNIVTMPHCKWVNIIRKNGRNKGNSNYN